MNKNHLLLGILLLLLTIFIVYILIDHKCNHKICKYSEILLKDNLKQYLNDAKDINYLMENVDSTAETKNFIEYHNNIIFIQSIFENIQRELETQSDNVSFERIQDYMDHRKIQNSDISQLLNVLKNNDLSVDDKFFGLLIIENFLFEHEFHGFHDLRIIPLQYGEVFNLPQKDTVLLGELYQSKILFSFVDLKNNIIVWDNGDTTKNGIFEEKALKRGVNNKKGFLEITSQGRTDFYPVDISYYVR